MNRSVASIARSSGGAGAVERRGLGWLAILGLLFQLIATTTHIHIDEEGWIGLPLPAGVAPLPAHHHAAPAIQPAAHRHAHSSAAALHAHSHDPNPGSAPGRAAGEQQRTKHPDCQICQSIPLVSASIASVALEITPATLGTVTPPIEWRSDAGCIALCDQARPRAPPVQA